MEEYRNSDVTAEDEAVLEAEEMADQDEVMSLDDDLGAVAVNDAVSEPAEAELEPVADEVEPTEADDVEVAPEAGGAVVEPETGDTEVAPEAGGAAVEPETGDTDVAPEAAAQIESHQAENIAENATEEADAKVTDDAVAAAGESTACDEQTPATDNGSNGNKKRPQLVTVVGIRFRTAGKAYYFSPGPYKVRHGMHVIVETARGVEYGTVVTMPMELDRRKVKSPLKEIIRIATPEDDATHKENRRQEREAYKVCFHKIRERRLDMKLIDAEYTFDHSKILFYFTADGRIDFRDLVKDLAGKFKTRIELRQIGVRDETKILGGYGSCGRPLCCHTYLSDFVPVSIKMAKEQNLSLNPTKISGVCGRLMCCLKNEQETYEELNKNLPRQGDEVEGPDGLQGEVESVNVLRQKVRILVEIDDEKEIHEYNADEITMIRRRKRGEAKHRSKRIENGQESADDLKRTTRKGGRPDRPAHMNDAERGNRADGERTARGENGEQRQARDGYRDYSERPAREGSRDYDERNNRGGDGERNGQNQGEGQDRSGRDGQYGRGGRRGGRGSREDRQNAAREHAGRENGGQDRSGRDGQNGRGGRGGRNRVDRGEQRGDRNPRNADGGSYQERTESGNIDNGNRGYDHGSQDRQNAGRNRHRRAGRGRGERPDGQNQGGGQNQTGGSNES